jgi:hypothetical protein
MGEARHVDCSSGDESHLFIASLTVARIRRANVAQVSRASLSTHSTPRVVARPEWLTPEQF